MQLNVKQRFSLPSTLYSLPFSLTIDLMNLNLACFANFIGNAEDGTEPEAETSGPLTTQAGGQDHARQSSEKSR